MSDFENDPARAGYGPEAAGEGEAAEAAAEAMAKGGKGKAGKGAAVAGKGKKRRGEEGCDLSQLVAWFEEAEEASFEARGEAERDIDYYNGQQLTESEKAVLRKRGQPDTINNEIQRKIDFLAGFETSQRTDPKAFPRNPRDEDAAAAASDMLRYQETVSDLDQIFSEVWHDMLVPGFGGVEVLGPKASNAKAIEVIHWHWDRLFHDPHSRRHDFSDARYLGGIVWMDADQAKSNFPEAEDAIDTTIAEEPVNSETYDDRPSRVSWARHGKRARVRVVQIYYRHGDCWHYAIFTKAGLINAQKIEFLDEDGEPDCPLILQSAFVDRQNARYGQARQFRGPQDEINKRTSKALHLISVAGGEYEEGAIDNIDDYAAAMARPDGWAKVNAGGLQKIRHRDAAKQAEAAGNLQLLQEAKQSIQMKGPNPALMGRTGASASGRAIRANQEGGIVELARLRDRHAHFKRRVYRAIWNRVRQFITAETFVRVTDDEKTVRFVGFNRKVTFAETAAREFLKTGMPEGQIDAAVVALAQEKGLDPNGVIGTEHVPAEMDMDILIENATESINIQEEQFDLLVQLAAAGVRLPPAAYVKASSLRNKEALLAELKPSAEDSQMKMAALELQLKTAMAKISEIAASADEKEAAAMVSRVRAGLPPEAMPMGAGPGMVPGAGMPGAQGGAPAPIPPELAGQARTV